ncbi:MAG: Coenzyme F420 hydrogenase/dehydrogenase, beta subunit C-terminal domain [Methanolobus sp.]|uniref:Coenzyme F420 hydrogenase/dehydrogenase, beta subunit C-terminal domain n=1 Tax=Methanolobus sp. TaxID=1874737 RepID=UPI0027321CA7|nr:Coenzyme F420 hydrogenase/dehydrogenase, beta subunit C-terminal domain [Methanolobus sp.]MDP2217755.1 Coenzyme F420 hydrogenase/dehydrogenase, beta subunit C-terminal domain [Methanolobus sp.]
MVGIGDKLLGYATNPDVRNRGASGGLVTAVLAAALEKGMVEGVVVLKRIDEYEAIPVITDDVQEVLASGGSMHAVPVNLTKHAVGRKIAMPGKPCDVRGVIEQAKRNGVDLENTYIVGLNCGGSMHPVVTREMLIRMYEIDPEDVVGEEIEKGKLIFKTKDGEEKAISIDELEEAGYGRRENCRYCTIKIPTNADLACGNWGVIGELAGSATFCEVMNEKGKRLLDNAIEAGFIEVQPADEKSIAIRNKVNSAMLKLGDEWKGRLLTEIHDQERLTYYIEQFADCIDCGACREVCPVCTCGEDSKCTMFHSLADNYKMSMYHMVRLLHLSDSCIGCGQCSDICPVDIPVTTIFRRFADPAQKKRDYSPGMDLQRPPFLELMLK